MINGADVMMEKLIEGQSNLNQRMAELSDRIGDLVNMEAARGEREHRQAEKNEQFESFMRENAEPLNRLRRFQKMLDSSITKLMGAAMLAGVLYIAVVITDNMNTGKSDVVQNSDK